MPEIRTPTERELPALLAFERRYTERDASLAEFREAYETWPELFVVAVEDGDLGTPEAVDHDHAIADEEDILAEASGYVARGEVVLASIAVREDHRGRGLGRRVGEAFEDRAAQYATTISVAAAGNVEGFYRELGYEPAKILLQIAEDDVPADGFPEGDGAIPENCAGEGARVVGERSPDADVRFVYVGFDEYDPALRRELKAAFDAFDANTIYEREVTE